MPDYVETDYPVENKDDSDMDDYVDALLEEIRNQSDDYNVEPSEEINPEWQGNTYFIYFYLDYFFKCNYIF